MRTSPSFWSQYVNRLFAPSPATAARRKNSRRPSTRLRSLERLEDRSVLSATFGSALSIGNELGSSSAGDVATDAAGNSYLTGSFSGTVDFDQAAAHAGDTDILTAGGTQDAFFAKYAADGSFLWAKQMNGAAGSSSIVRTVTTDANGNVYLGGDFTGTVDFGVYTLTSDVARDGFAAKLDSSGNVQWAQRWGGANKEMTNGIAVDGAGNVFATGTTTRYNADGSVASSNMLVEKLSASGTPLWAKQIGNTNGGNEGGSGIDTDSAGNVYVGGQFRGTVDFDPGAGKKNVNGGPNDSSFVLKLTPAGAYGWVSTFENQNSAAGNGCRDLVVDGSNNIIVGGAYRGSVDFKPGGGTLTLPYEVYSGTVFGGGYIAKLNSAGSLVWAQPVGNGFAFVTSLALDSAGNVYATGNFQGTDTGVTHPSDFDPGVGTNILTCNGVTDVFVTKFSAAGAYQWAVSVGGTGTDWARGIAVDNAGNIYVAGTYFNTVDFDPDPISTSLLTSTGGSDGFLLKLRQS